MNEVDRLKRDWQKQDDTEIDGAINALFEHRNGRRLLWWLLTIGRVGTQPYAGNALNTAFSCGELNVGQQILDRMIAVSPDGYVNTMKENVNERSERDTAINAARDNGRNSAVVGERDLFDGDTADARTDN